MTITIKEDQKVIDQVIKQLNKLIDVIEASRLDPANIVTREMALVKVHASTAGAKSDAIITPTSSGPAWWMFPQNP